MRKTLLAMAIGAALSACAVTQPQPPKLDLPAATASDAQNELLEHWWTAFDDPVLTALIEEAYANNLDLKAALARIEAARATLLLAQSNLYPSVSLAVDGTRTRPSQIITQSTEPPGTPVGAIPSVSNNLGVGLQMSYELDLWGKYRSGALAASNDVVGARFDREAVRIAVAANVAHAYFELRAADALLVVLEDTRKTRRETVNLQTDRFDGGIIGEYDLRQAEA